MKGLLFIVCAPSGAGKSSLIEALLKEDAALTLSVSYTTRAPRPGEQPGREYFFVDEQAFLAMLERGEFLESALVHGNRYGTSHQVIRDTLERGRDLLLEIDWQGAQQVRRLIEGAIGIFILPPSLEELAHRLRGRGKDSEEVIRRRLANAHEEMDHVAEFEYAIINKDFDEARRDLAAVIRAERARCARQLDRHPELFQKRP
jgi:guanylate kinase